MTLAQIPAFTWWWIVLIGATALSWQFGHGLAFGAQVHYGTVFVLVITSLKVRVVFLEFMELRHVPLPLRLVFEAWTGVVAGAVLWLHWPAS